MPQERPDHAQIMAAVAEVDVAVTLSRATRARWKRRQAPAREDALKVARLRCADVVSPLRSWLGMVQWGGVVPDDELAMKRAVAAARYERRQIDKML